MAPEGLASAPLDAGSYESGPRRSIRTAYVHDCGGTTHLGVVPAVNHAYFAYPTAFCSHCESERPITEFDWLPRSSSDSAG